MKLVDKTIYSLKDRVSAILMIILSSSLLIWLYGAIESISMTICIIALIADVIWSFVILPKKENVLKLSKIENIILFIYSVFFFSILFIMRLAPEILPSWTGTALIIILFALLTFFSINAPIKAK